MYPITEAVIAHVSFPPPVPSQLFVDEDNWQSQTLEDKRWICGQATLDVSSGSAAGCGSLPHPTGLAGKVEEHSGVLLCKVYNMCPLLRWDLLKCTTPSFCSSRSASIQGTKLQLSRELLSFSAAQDRLCSSGRALGNAVWSSFSHSLLGRDNLQCLWKDLC